jgi:acetoin utilization protein AcuC
VGRLWTAIWGLVAGQALPDRLPEPATRVLAALSWNGGSRPAPEPHLLTTLLDTPREGPVRAEIRDRLAHLARR